MNATPPLQDNSIRHFRQPCWARWRALLAVPSLAALALLTPQLRAKVLYLDFAETATSYTTTGWTPVSLANALAGMPNVGGSGYYFTFAGVGAYGNSATQTLTGSGFHNKNNYTIPKTFTLTGLNPNKPVQLYACAAWNGNTAGGYIVYGDTGAAGKKAQTNGDPGTTGTLANLTLIGTAIANGSGMVTGDLWGRNSATATGNAEGQVGAFVFIPTQIITASAGANGTVSPLGATDAFAGTSPVYTITANSGYHVADVLVDGVSVGAIGSYTFDNLAANHTISATFASDTAASYTIAASAGDNGTISPAGVINAFEGTSKPFTISANTGYHIAEVLVDGTSVGAVAGYTFGNVTANHTIAASFAINTYTLTPIANANGSISPAIPTTLNYGDSQEFIITPDAGYYIASLQVDGALVPPVSPFTFTDVTAAHTITATFDNRTRLYLDFTNGSYTTGWTPVFATTTTDTMVNVSSVGGTAYGFSFGHVATWDGGNATQSLTRSGFYNYGGIANAHPFALTGLIPGQAVSLYACAGWGGNGAGAYLVYGDTGTAGKKAQTIGDPGINPVLSNLTLIGTAIVDATGTVAGNMYGAAGVGVAGEGQVGGFMFAIEAPPQRTITASAGPNGTISPSGPVTMTSGDSQTFIIAANSGYHIADVLVDGVTVGAVSEYTFNTVTADHTISATFDLNTVAYTITASAGANGSISPSGAVVLNQGVSQIFTITADPAYHIADVMVDGVSVGAVSSYPFTNLAANHTISASFAINTYTITASAGTNGTITPNGPTTVNQGDAATFTFTADPDYHIDEVWVDGVSVGAVSEYTFYDVTANHTINASFDNRTKLKLDFTQSGGSYANFWTPSYANWLADTPVATSTNIGGLGYEFAVEHVGTYDNGHAWEPLTRSGFYTVGTNTNPHAFSLKGLILGQAVKLYACAGWDGNARGAMVVYGNSGAAGVLAQTIGTPGISPTLANLTLIGTATADATGTVTGSVHGHDGVNTDSEGQVGAFVFVIEPSSTLADADGDGMNDGWEVTYFGSTDEPADGDFDHDGTNNLTEFRLGLIPNKGSSRFAATLTAGQLQWPSAAGVTFTIERSATLAADSWTVLDAAFQGSVGTANYTDTEPPAGSAFYRIKLNP